MIVSYIDIMIIGIIDDWVIKLDVTVTAINNKTIYCFMKKKKSMDELIFKRICVKTI